MSVERMMEAIIRIYSMVKLQTQKDKGAGQTFVTKTAVTETCNLSKSHGISGSKNLTTEERGTTSWNQNTSIIAVSKISEHSLQESIVCRRGRITISHFLFSQCFNRSWRTTHHSLFHLILEIEKLLAIVFLL